MEYKITICDRFMLENHLDVVIPLTIYLRRDIIVVECYEEFQQDAAELCEKFGENVLDKTNIGEFEKKLASFCDENGYDAAGRKIKKCYICDENTSLNINDKVDTVEIDCKAEYKNELEIGLDPQMYDEDDYPYKAVGVFEDDKLVCAACENSHYYDNDEETEIGIETAENHRKRGFASAAVAHLCSILRENGRKKIYYECSLENTASENTAKSAGLDFYSINYYYVSYRKDN